MVFEKQQQLLWKARRGMLELDLLLQPFIRDVYPQLTASEQNCFDQLLDQEDTLLYHWLMGIETPPEMWASLLEQMKQYHARFRE